MKLTGILKSPNEILGVEGENIISFETKGCSYPSVFYEYAGRRVRLKLHFPQLSDYDYNFWVEGSGIIGWVKKGWLRNIIEETDWSKVPVDAEIEVVKELLIFRGHFSHIGTNGMVYLFPSGATSWSVTVLHRNMYNPCFCRLVK